MKKLFTLAAAVLASFSLWAADPAALSYESFSSTELIYTSASAMAALDYAQTGNGDKDFVAPGSSRGDGINPEDESTTYSIGTNAVNLKNSAAKWVYIYITNVESLDAYIRANSSGRTTTITATPTEGDAVVGSFNHSSSGSGKISLTLNPSKSYTVKFEATNDVYMYALRIVGVATADHSKATVKSISVDGEKLADFAADKLTYNIELDYGTVTIPEVSAVAGDDATININQASTLPGSATVVCKSYDESTSVTYTINFSVAATASTDATLKSLSLDGKAIAGFAADKLEYDVELEFDATAAPEITAEKNESHANVVINQAAALPGIATVVVTAQDGETSLTYTINFTKETLVPIIRATHSGAKTATVKGSIGGTADKNTQDNGKLGSNEHYFGIKLADDKKFQAGDSIVILASLLNGGNTATIFTDKGTTELASVDFSTETLMCTYTLTAEADAIYIYRKSSACNPNVQSISVYRKTTPTALDNTEATVKATKRIVNGQLLIEKNGVMYNAQGAVVR